MQNKFWLLGIISLVLLAGCSSNANIQVTTQNGACANTESYAPYCMAVTIQNNNGGQNYINSTNFPISNLTMTTSGATNVLTPTNSKSMDPNNCTGSNLNPGSNCTFYLQITNESYPAMSSQSVNINMTYNIQNSFLNSTFGLGSSTPTASTSFSITQTTNLYAMQSNGYLWTFGTSASYVNIESFGDSINSLAVDNTAYGFLYLGGNNGIYQFGESSSVWPSISIAPLTGANNLLSLSGTLYASGSSSGGVGVWGFNLTGESWVNGNSPAYVAGTTFNTNANTVSPSAVIYLANSNQVYSCSNTSTTKTCTSEGNPVSESGQTAYAVQGISFLTGVNSPYTGLYAGTSDGLFYEIGNTPSANAVWKHVQYNESALHNSILSTTSFSGSLFAGDSIGNIYQVNSSTPTTTSIFMNAAEIGKFPIPNMLIDVNGNILYFVSNNSGTYSLYACSLLSTPCKPLLIQSLGTNSIAGLGIGSQLSG